MPSLKILLIHNRYQQRGGEDAVFEAETRLLREHGQQVSTLEFSNADLLSLTAKLKMSYRIFYNPVSVRQLEEQILDFQPDVIHVHNFFYVASPGIFVVAARHQVPVVLTLHNYRLICAGALLLRNGLPCELCVHQQFPLHGVIHGCFGGSPLKSAQLTLMTGIHKMLGTFRNKIAKYITLTSFAQQKILDSSLQVTENQVVVKPNSVADRGFAEGATRQEFFLFVGRLSEEKGIRVLLNAAENQPFKLEIIGEGEPEMNEFVKEVAATHPNITFHGFQQQDFILEKLKNCLALVFPSVWYEGLPMTILEAFSTGTPVIASDQQNLNRIVTDQQTGLLFRTGNPESLAQTLRFLVANRPTLMPLYENARLEYLSKYTPEQNYKALLAIYETVIS